MSEAGRSRRPTEREMEELLRDVGADLPPEPDVSASVRSRLEAESRPVIGRSWTSSPALRIAAALVLILLVSFPVVNLMRGGVMSTSGGAAGEGQSEAPDGGLEQRVESPEPPASSSDAGEAARSSSGAAVTDWSRLGLGEKISLERADDIFGSPLPLPQQDGVPVPPDAVYGSGDTVVLVYGEREGLPGIGDTYIGATLSYSRIPTSRYLDGLSDTRSVEPAGRATYWLEDGGLLETQAGDIEDLPGGAVIREVRGGSVIVRTVAPEAEAVQFARSIR